MSHPSPCLAELAACQAWMFLRCVTGLLLVSDGNRMAVEGRRGSQTHFSFAYLRNRSDKHLVSLRGEKNRTSWNVKQEHQRQDEVVKTNIAFWNNLEDNFLRCFCFEDKHSSNQAVMQKKSFQSLFQKEFKDHISRFFLLNERFLPQKAWGWI